MYKYLKYLYFYSIWGLIFNLLYFFGIIGNTYPIALFILVFSQVMLFIYPSYITNKDIKVNWFYEFFLHWLPILIITPSFLHINYLYMSLSLYIIIFNTKILTIYKNPIKFLNS